MPGGGTPEATCVAHADKENANAAWQDTGMEAISTVSLEDRSGGVFLCIVSPFLLCLLHVVFHRFPLFVQSQRAAHRSYIVTRREIFFGGGSTDQLSRHRIIPGYAGLQVGQLGEVGQRPGQQRGQQRYDGPWVDRGPISQPRHLLCCVPDSCLSSESVHSVHICWSRRLSLKPPFVF